MSRRVWLALALAAVTVVSFAASSVAANSHAADPRPRRVTKSLDYFHARQTDAGGFGSMANTAWGIMGAVASGERVGSSAWSIKDKNPFQYLQSNSHEAAASADTNAPVYYARAIMAYAAVGRIDRIPVAGAPSVNLLNKLYSYQDWTVDAATGSGSFSPWNPSNPPSFRMDVHTTAWAILALSAIREGGTTRFTKAVSWLADKANANGGFPSESVAGEPSNLEDTAVVIQALIAGGRAKDDPVVLAARKFLLDEQNNNAGFPLYKKGGATNATATSAAIQAALAMDEDPRNDAAWKKGASSPETALAKLQHLTGAYSSTAGHNVQPLTNTSWALIALRHKPFTTFPRSIGAPLKAFVFRPALKTISPKDGAKFNHTRIVLIRATYTDGEKGTGVRPSACRVYVDKVNKSKPAVIGHYGLHLELKNVANGDHTYTLLIVDHAGNVKTVERTFKVNVVTPIPTSAPTTAPTYNPAPAPIYPTTRPVTPKPVQTLYPSPASSGSATPYPSVTPYPSGAPVTGAPVTSPSPSGSPGAVGAGGDDGGGSAAGFLGGTLLAMLPIGALLSYFAFRRRELALNGAGEGKMLEGGGSAWDRIKQTLGKSKDIVKPAGS
jgi:hypothetical protein